MGNFCSSDNVKLNFLDYGSGLPIVMMAGYGGSAETHISQSDALVEAGFRVILFDRRSHGASENAIQGQHLTRHAADVYELAAYLNLKDFIIAGHSMGASTVYAYFSVFGSANVRAGICIDQTPRMINDETWNLGMYGLTRDNMGHFFDDIAMVHERSAKEMSANIPGYAEMVAANPEMMQAPPFDFERTRPLLFEHAWADWRDVLPSINVPILFIAGGSNNAFWSSEHAKYCAEQCPKGQCVIIEGAGHLVPMVKPAECNEAMVKFVKEVS